MPDVLPQVFPQPTREELRDAFLRDFRYWSESGIATDEGTQPWLDANTLADLLVPAYLQIAQSGRNLVLTEATGKAAEAWAEAAGMVGRIAATGASGFVVITASVGGTTILAGDELKTNNGLRFEVAQTGTYTADKLVPIRGIDTGPATNLPAGTQLTWTAPRPGCGSTATVWADADGNGLSGGRLEETDAEIHERVIEAKRNPPSSGNDAHVQALVRATPGLAVQAAFTIPAVFGPGTTAVLFTLQPATDGGSRLPNNAQLAQVEGWLANQLPGDDSVFVCALQSSSVDVAVQVQWQPGVDGWADATPWPPFYAGSGAVTVQTVTDGTHFVLQRLVGGYVGVPQPRVGNTIAFYDPTTRTFFKKRIASVTGTGPWTLVADASNHVSDAYVPVAGQRAMPYSPSLPLLVAPLAAEFGRLGPGEQFASFWDEGSRQRRQPPAPLYWPHTLGNRAINGVQDLSAVADATLVEPSVPLATTVGTPGVVSNLLTLGKLSVYALP